MDRKGETEIKSLEENIFRVAEKVKILRQNAKDKLNKMYVEFKPIIYETDEIINESRELYLDIEDLQSKLSIQTKECANTLKGELRNMKDLLFESSIIVVEVGKLCEIQKHLLEAKKMNKLENHFETAKHLSASCKILNEDYMDIEEYLDVLKGLTITISYLKADYSMRSLEAWKQFFVWSHINGDLNNITSSSSLHVSSNKSHLEVILKTLELYDLSNKELAVFSDNLLQCFLIPIIDMVCNISIKKMTSNDEIVISSYFDSDGPSYQQVLEKLTIFFQFFEQVLGIRMEDTSFVGMLGEYIADDFLSLLVEKCLTDITNVRREQNTNYAPITELMTDFQSLLIRIGFIPENNRLLEEHFGNVEESLMNKTMENYLDTARSLMKRDLQELVKVEDSSVKIKQEDTKRIKHEDPSESNNYNSKFIDVDTACPNLFKFPKCYIRIFSTGESTTAAPFMTRFLKNVFEFPPTTQEIPKIQSIQNFIKSVEELINLINAILTERLSSKVKPSTKLFHLVRNIVLIYPDLVYTYHTKLLCDVPQCSALFYNNLMYLSHQLLKIEYDKKSQSDKISPIFSFADLIIPLKNKAIDTLNEQIMVQQEILLELIKESGVSVLNEFEELPECTEKSIQGCLRQLFLLEAAWKKILPADRYSEVIGVLCTVVINEITNKICITRDIRPSIVPSLIKALSIIEINAPKLFSNPREVYSKIKSWTKLKELIIVLGASLTEIQERWADGKGPLAIEFSASQVGQLIKALFHEKKKLVWLR